MTKAEVYEFIRTIKASTVGFSVDPERACDAWFNALRDCNKREAWEAVDHIITNTDSVPTLHSIKQRIGAQHYRERKKAEDEQGDHWMRVARESFERVPGKNKGQKVVFVCAQRAAEKWLSGEQNEFFGDLLLQGRAMGFVFEGIDYSRITNTGSGVSAGFLKMAREA